MTKKLISVMILLLCFTAFASAQVRLDVNVSIPFYNGIEVEGSEGIGDFSSYAFLIPDLMLSYVFDFEIIKIGIGARMLTFIVESVMWPNAFVELDLSPLVINVSCGGGIFAYFGVVSGVETSSLIIPDACAYFKFNDWFQAGVGVVLFVGAEVFGVDILPYSVYARARFSFTF
jgi:hypothetical protein